MFWAGDFVAAKITSDSTLSALVGDRLFAVARDNVAESEDLLPYIIMTPQSFVETSTKDGIDAREVSFDLLVCADTYAEQAGVPVNNSYASIVSLLHKVFVDDCIYPLTYVDSQGHTTEVYNCDFAVSPPQYDPDKPCFYGAVALKFTIY